MTATNDEDSEVSALATIVSSLAKLSEEQRRNVLLYLNTRFSGIPGVVGVRPAAPSAAGTGTGPAEPDYETVGDLFSAAGPETESDRALVVAYWIQQVEGAGRFEAFAVNKHLKELGHGSSNITTDLGLLIRQKPQLVIQTGKSGSTRQARKTYRVTREGIARVQAMVSGRQSAAGGNDGS